MKQIDLNKTSIFALSLMISACSSLHMPQSCSNCTTDSKAQSPVVAYRGAVQKDEYYRCNRAADLQGKVIGDGHCVALIRSCSDAPLTAQWRAGQQVIQADVQAGTIIATFSNGRYPNQNGWHAAIFIKQDEKGIWVWDQWMGKPVHRRLIRFRESNEQAAAANTAQDYRVVTSQ